MDKGYKVKEKEDFFFLRHGLKVLQIGFELEMQKMKN